MKIFIFCGGFGTRLNKGKPGPLKPLIKINNKALLEHILNIFYKYGFNNFYLLGGYKLKELVNFAKYKKFKITVIDSGIGTSTAGRLLHAKKYLKKGEIFFLTYGDSLANFKPKKALKFKNRNNFTISAYDYKLPYGILNIQNKKLVKKFYEKNRLLTLNAGFYVLDYRIFNYIKSKTESFEKNTLPRVLSGNIKLTAVKLKKWQPVDNIYDIECVEKILKLNKNYFYE